MGSDKKKDKKKDKKASKEKPVTKKVEKEKKKDKKKIVPSPEPESDESSEEPQAVPQESSDSSEEQAPKKSQKDDTSSDSSSEEELPKQIAKRKPEGQDTPSSKRSKGSELTLYAGNLPFTTTKEDLEEFLSECDVSDVRLVKNSNDGNFKGYGYVDFNSEDGLHKALELNGEDFNGRSIKLDRTSNQSTEKSKVVFVGNLSFHTDEDALRNFFSECGGVSSVRLITDKDTGRLKGFGYVEFEDENAAEVAVSYHGHELDGRALRINYETGSRKSQGDRGGRGGGRGFGGRGGGRGFGGRDGGGRGGGRGFGGRGGDRGGGRGFGGRGGDRGGGRGFGGRGGDRGGRGGRGNFSKPRGDFKGSRTTYDD